MEYWGEVPPPHVSLMLIASAHGAKFATPSPDAQAAQGGNDELEQLIGSIPQRAIARANGPLR